MVSPRALAVLPPFDHLVGSGSHSSESLPLLPLRAPDLNARHGVDLPRSCPPGANIPDVLVVVKEPPRDADSRLTLAEVEERLVGPACPCGQDWARRWPPRTPSPIPVFPRDSHAVPISGGQRGDSWARSHRSGDQTMSTSNVRRVNFGGCGPPQRAWIRSTSKISIFDIGGCRPAQLPRSNTGGQPRDC